MLKVITLLLALLSAVAAFAPGVSRPAFSSTRLNMADDMKKGTVKWYALIIDSVSRSFSPHTSSLTLASL